jgi:hypothetical protein
MSNTFTSMVDFQVKDGRQVKLKYDSVKADAIDICSYELRRGETKLFELQPSNASDRIRFLLIWRTPVDPKAENKPDPMKLTFKLNGTGESIPLEDHHVIIGYGIFKLLKETPRSLEVKNAQDNSVLVSVLVGRDFPPYESAAEDGDEDEDETDDDETDDDETDDGSSSSHKSHHHPHQHKAD